MSWQAPNRCGEANVNGFEYVTLKSCHCQNAAQPDSNRPIGISARRHPGWDFALSQLNGEK
jgi:hypothetical protein